MTNSREIKLYLSIEFSEYERYLFLEFGHYLYVSYTQKVQLGLSSVGSSKKSSQGRYGLGMDIIKPWEAKTSNFPDLILRTGHLKSADFSTLKNQVLIVRFQI